MFCTVSPAYLSGDTTGQPSAVHSIFLTWRYIQFISCLGRAWWTNILAAILQARNYVREQSSHLLQQIGIRRLACCRSRIGRSYLIIKQISSVRIQIWPCYRIRSPYPHIIILWTTNHRKRTNNISSAPDYKPYKGLPPHLIPLADSLCDFCTVARLLQACLFSRSSGDT